MLQQTQVKTVQERYYAPFLERFPTLLDLSCASIDEVLKAWEGLGYYSRARNLHKSAQVCQTSLPKNAQELEKLAGIGKSTAHAIACFAYGEALPILDANVKRILHRYFALKSATTKALWDYSYQLFDRQNAYAFNQAMMDIGALICTHKNPQCRLCPLQKSCQGKENPSLYPTQKPKKIKPVKTPAIIIYQKEESFALFRNETRLLGGLWSFAQQQTAPKEAKKLGSITHHYSHFSLKASIFLSHTSPKEAQWFTRKQIDTLALSGADKKVLAFIT